MSIEVVYTTYMSRLFQVQDQTLVIAKKPGTLLLDKTKQKQNKQNKTIIVGQALPHKCSLGSYFKKKLCI
jgi:hypothetical protein